MVRLFSHSRLFNNLQSMSKKHILAVDIDEVLAFFIPALAEFHNENYGTSLVPESFFSYEFFEVWGGTQAETSAKMDEFFESRFFKDEMKPIPGAFESLLVLKIHFDLHIVTSRQNKLKDITLQWIDRYFPNVFTEVHLGNHYSSEGKSRTKSEICHSIGACLLIDDSTKYAIQCVHDNIPVLLFGNYAWNRISDDKIPNDVELLQYSSSTVFDDSNGILSRISSDINTSIINKFNISVRPDLEKFKVYRVNDWKDVERVIITYFGLDK